MRGEARVDGSADLTAEQTAEVVSEKSAAAPPWQGQKGTAAADGQRL
jgi:hypothetical protein